MWLLLVALSWFLLRCPSAPRVRLLARTDGQVLQATGRSVRDSHATFFGRSESDRFLPQVNSGGKQLLIWLRSLVWPD